MPPATALPAVPVFRPAVGDDELAAAREALELGWLGMGSYVGAFEQGIRDRIGGERQVVALSTGHAALHLAFLLAGVGPGDEVITPAFNNVADFQAILACGARPVFCDIDDSSLCLDADRARDLVSPHTKAIVVMDYACVLADHEALRTLAAEYGIRLVHDAAHSFGAADDDGPIGSNSDLCIFSFDPVKTVTSIDGGALVVSSEHEAEQLREMRLLGMTQPSSVMYENRRAWTYDVRGLGFRYHLANLHAAIGLAQLGRLDDILDSRRQTCRAYAAAFTPLAELRTPPTAFDDGAPFLFYVRLPGGSRDAFRDHLATRGVDTGVHWQPGHHFQLFEGCRAGDLAVTEAVVAEIVTLPLHSFMADDDRDRVIDSVRSFFCA